MVTLAPERAGALRFIEQLAADGVVVAIGHTAATGRQIRDAVKAGARTSTHLGNGCHAVLPRHDNYVWEQLALVSVVRPSAGTPPSFDLVSSASM